MTKRTLGLISLSATTILLFNEQMAYSSDTIWDLLRRGDPVQKRDTPTFPLDAAALGVGLAAPPVGRAGQVLVPAVGQPFGRSEQVAQGPATIWDLLRQGDPAQKRDTPTIPLNTTAGSAMGAGNPGARLVLNPKTGKWDAGGAALIRPSSGFMGFFGKVGGNLRRLGKALHSDLKISGYRNMGLHAEKISGSSTSYTTDNYFGRQGIGGMYNNTDVTVEGKILGLVNFSTHYTDKLYASPNENRLSLNYAGKHFKVDAGDIQAGITGNSLIDFSRALKGIEVSGDVLRGLRLTGLFSQTAAQTRTIVLQGNGRSDGYYVYAGQIVDGSEKVRVNNKELVKGQDYQLDPITGELKFLNGLILSPSDVIAVTFETYGYGVQAGTISGFRADLGFLRTAKFGLTYLSQASPNGNRPLAQKKEQFPPYSPGSPYDLTYPIDVTVTKDSKGNLVATPKEPMIVTVNNVPQTLGKDYVINPVLPNQVFINGVFAPNTIIQITYTPANTNTADGNRNVYGADTSISLGKIGHVAAEMASSTLAVPGQSIGGSAWQLLGDMHFLKDKLTWNWNLHDIGNNFTAIQSPGFNRNEKGLTMAMNYAPSRNLRLTASFDKSQRPDFNNSILGSSTSAYTQASGSDNYNQMTLGVQYQLGKAGQLSLNHNSMSTLLYNGGKTVFGSDTLDFNYGLKSLKLGLSLGRNMNQSLYNTNTTGGSSSTNTTGLYSYNNNSLSERFLLTWTASHSLNLSTTISNSSMDLGGGKKTNAQNIQLNSDIVPLRNMHLQLGYQFQTSGSASAYNTTSSTNTGNRGAPVPSFVTRDGTTGGTSTLPTFGNPAGYPGYGTYDPGSVYGGGYNGGLGSYGNYSGGFTNSNGYLSSGYGGNSRTLTAALVYQPFQALNLSFNWNSSYSEGSYLLNSRSNNIAFVTSYNVGDRLSFTTNMSLQKVSYVGSTGGTNNNTLGLNIHTRPFGRLSADLTYMRMRSNSAQSSTSSTTYPTGTYDPNSTGTGGFVPTFGAFSTNINSYGLHLDYPIWRGNSLYFTLDNSTTGGYGAAIQSTMTFGMNFNLIANTVFALGWRVQKNNSLDKTLGSSYNYSVNSLDANINMRF